MSNVLKTRGDVIRIIAVVVILVMTSCARPNTRKVDQNDDYSRAAMSWLGGEIDEMVAAWGTPNRGFLAAAGKQRGVAGWEVRSYSGSDIRYHCASFAYFNSNGTILKIVVKHSYSCHRRFKNGFETMTRDNII